MTVPAPSLGPSASGHNPRRVQRALDPAAEAVVRRVWAGRLGLPVSELNTDDVVFVERPDLAAAVVVRLGATTAVAAPCAALADLRRVDRAQLLDVLALLAALEPHRPSLLGAASLSFADDRATMTPVVDGVVRAADASEVEAVLSLCSSDERDESGLAEMGVRWMAPDSDGQPAALAGYDAWDAALAHMGVAVVPGGRGRRLGERAAKAAARHATDDGLIPQWRCRLGNVASARLRDRLGFVQLGEQIAIDLGDRPSAPVPD